MPIPPASFDAHLRVVDLTKIVSSRTVIAGLRTSRKYRAIASSMQELGMVKPLVIHPIPNVPTTYLLLDGHLRLFSGHKAPPPRVALSPRMMKRIRTTSASIRSQPSKNTG
jgi:ParB-like chromosome segregation protein Spo0J